ncbi:MAG: fibronectin type III domain-containing protein [Flavobacteriaceae bacterium]|uniref:fibronectin type III domain-containing protein n=1 Tax=Maribacter dokdonensis TaxID=320912 RepID=UPI00326F06D0
MKLHYKVFLNSMFMLFALLSTVKSYGQTKEGVITINTKEGHPIKVGSSGFNVRIADKSWNYTHPDFRKAVHQLKPGWLRYFSGTMGDAFSSATGLYDIDYAMMFDHPKQYLKGYRFTQVKGPHRITDLYDLLGEINGKLIITVNGFSETPEMTRELARFCKNNNIEVATWQFCNEPYFYVPHRGRYWWNNGYDYAAKMKPHADAIKEIFPDAFLALNFTWDGIWGFMKEINDYQKEHGAYWNVFSKHSYAPHIGKKEELQQAYKRGNTKLIEATSAKAMQEIEDYASKDIPMVITEFGVWNKPLNGIYSSIYNIEYVMRQLQHTNTWFVGAHEVSSKYEPEKNINAQIEQAFKNRASLKTDSIPTGIHKTLEGKAYELYHEVTNNADFIFNSNIKNGAIAPGLNEAKEKGCFSQAYRGVNGYNYVVFTNRTNDTKDYKIVIDGNPISERINVTYLTADSLKVLNTAKKTKLVTNGKINIAPFSLTIAKWKSSKKTKPQKPTLYKGEIDEEGIRLTWGKVSNAEKYNIYFREESEALQQKISVTDTTVNSIEIEKLKKGATYFFKMVAENNQGSSTFSNQITLKNSIPKRPEIFKTSRRNTTATIFWKSVPNVLAYKLRHINTKTNEVTILNTNNVFGFRVEGLAYNIPYQFSVAGYNGHGLSDFSEPVTLVLSDKVPLSPRNISAQRNEEGTVSIHWIEQDSIHPQTTYNVYRGEQLHQYKKIAKDITGNNFEDTSTEKGKIYYYTIKAETSAGESNFYPNIASLYPENKEYSIEITSVEKQKNGYLLRVEFSNLLLTKDEYSFGVQLENISYLTVEETTVEGENMKLNASNFMVFIPDEKLAKRSKYSIKAFINTSDKNYTGKLSGKYILTD